MADIAVCAFQFSQVFGQFNVYKFVFAFEKERNKRSCGLEFLGGGERRETLHVFPFQLNNDGEKRRVGNTIMIFI